MILKGSRMSGTVQVVHCIDTEGPLHEFLEATFAQLRYRDPHHEWRYVFDGDTFPLEAVEAVGVAANNSYGTATVRVLYPETGRVTRRLWGE